MWPGFIRGCVKPSLREAESGRCLNYNLTMLIFTAIRRLVLEHTIRAGSLLSPHAIFLGSQEVAVRSAYARSKPG